MGKAGNERRELNIILEKRTEEVETQRKSGKGLAQVISEGSPGKNKRKWQVKMEGKSTLRWYRRKEKQEALHWHFGN